MVFTVKDCKTIMIFLDKVLKEYRVGEKGVCNISLSIKSGEFVSIVGHSGAGKSTLLKIILGEIKPTDGVIFFDSEDVTKMNKRRINKYRRKIGTVFQDFRLLPKKNVYENIAFAMEVSGRPDNEIEKDVPYVLKLVGLQGKKDYFPHELSGGQKQRVAIARAIINHPDLIIADEPTGNLDPVNAHDIIEILKKINELGTTVIVTTHNKSVVENIGKRVVTLDRGHIIRDEVGGNYVI